MGKKRIVKKGSNDSSVKSGAGKKLPRKKLDSGILYVQSTFNNTKLLLTDTKGNAICAASSGALGFKGAKRELLLQLQKQPKNSPKKQKNLG